MKTRSVFRRVSTLSAPERDDDDGRGDCGAERGELDAERASAESNVQRGERGHQRGPPCGSGILKWTTAVCPARDVNASRDGL